MYNFPLSRADNVRSFFVKRVKEEESHSRTLTVSPNWSHRFGVWSSRILDRIQYHLGWYALCAPCLVAQIIWAPRLVSRICLHGPRIYAKSPSVQPGRTDINVRFLFFRTQRMNNFPFVLSNCRSRAPEHYPGDQTGRKMRRTIQHDIGCTVQRNIGSYALWGTSLVTPTMFCSATFSVSNWRNRTPGHCPRCWRNRTDSACDPIVFVGVYPRMPFCRVMPLTVSVQNHEKGHVGFIQILSVYDGHRRCFQIPRRYSRDNPVLQSVALGPDGTFLCDPWVNWKIFSICFLCVGFVLYFRWIRRKSLVRS